MEIKPDNHRTFKDFFHSRKFWRPFLGVFIGGTAGFLYFHFAGCTSGSCLITSHSYNTIIFGGISGYLIAG